MTVCTLALCAAVMIYSEECSEGALNGLEYCFKMLIPSLFPFMAISSFIVKSGLSYKLGRPFRLIMKKLFGLQSSFAPVILLSVLGGYPVGAKGISALFESGCVSREQAEKAAMFAVCSGPGFLVNFVGVSLYNNEKIGFIILASQVISVILIGIVLNLCDKNRNNYISDKELYSKSTSLSSSIVESAADSSRGILSICTFVVLFSAFTGILNSVVGEGIFKNCILCLLEVCSAVNSLSKDCSVEFVAFAVGFGGLSVHFQIFSSLGKLRINKLLFFCIRIIQGIITALLTHLGMILFVKEAMVFSTDTVQKADTFNGTIISGIALIAVSLCFLYSLKNYKRR